MWESEGSNQGQKYVFPILWKLHHPPGIISTQGSLKENVSVSVTILMYCFIDSLLHTVCRDKLIKMLKRE